MQTKDAQTGERELFRFNASSDKSGVALKMKMNPFSWPMSVKIPAMIVTVGVLAVGLTGSFAFMQSRKAVEYEATSKLTAVMEDRETALSQWLKGIEGDLTVQAQNPLIHHALKAFVDGWKGLEGNPKERLQKLYVTDNPNPTGSKEKLDAASDGSAYSQAHAKYHPYLRAFLQDRGYYDIFLINPQGNVVYTVFKELDYASNLVSGKWANTDLGKAFRTVRDNPRKGSKVFFDFKPYAPSHGAPASFISTPILGAKGELHGVLVFQMPIGKLNALMQQTAGLGKTGETYIVGTDLLMRSDSRFSKGSTILKTKVDTEQVRLALKGQAGRLTGTDYRGEPVVAAYKPLKFLNTTWAVIAEQETGEAFASVISMRNVLLLGSGAGFVLILIVGFFSGRSVSQPISRVTQVMVTLADGDDTVDIPGINRKDEIGAMSRAVQVFKENAIRNKELVAEQEEQKRRIEDEKIQIMHKLADDFDASVGGIIETVSSATAELNSTAETMSNIARETSNQSAAVSAASEEAATNVQTVAAAAEEMSHSISEINQQVNQASSSSKKAVNEVRQTAGQIESLAATADRISGVIGMISEIAEQTNLLALNATIESARAGEAGKGFAVVASEVKSLAGQTAKATEDIIAQVNDIQQATKQAVVSMSDIGEIIRQVDETSAAIAASVEEQGMATQEIARNVQEAASGTDEVSRNITGVNQASQEAGAASGQVMSAAGELSRQSEVLRTEVGKFISQIRNG